MDGFRLFESNSPHAQEIQRGVRVEQPIFQIVSLNNNVIADIKMQIRNSWRGPYYVKIYSSVLNYWIIDKENNQVYGPLSLESFVEERKRLNVPEKLSVVNDE